jgi:rhodanese-related sulfurtransferase
MATVLKKNDPAGAQRHFESKMAFTTGPVELNNNLKQGTDLVVVDVREAEDYDKGHVPGAINLPYDKWSTRDGLSRDKLNVLYCYSHVCHLAAMAAVEFAKAGYSVMEMDGGFEAWQENELEVVTESAGERGKRQPAMASR